MSRARARCATIADMTATDREAIATNVRALMSEDEFDTMQAVLGIEMILKGVGLSVDDLALLVYDPADELRLAA